MSARLPPLNALRAFEAVARHLSIKKAAAELHVTPAAVGHQIRVLESYLDTQLFHRLNRGLRLTDAGQACLPELREGFALLSKGVERARIQRGELVLTVSVAPGFALRWLVPRLDSFLETYPDIEVRIESNRRLVDLNSEKIDVAIRFSSIPASNMRSDLLFYENVSPVCSPVFCQGERAIRKPQDLRRHTLIHLLGETKDACWPDWPGWLAGAGVTDIDGYRGPRFNQTGTAEQAAIDGQGIALTGFVCVADEIAAGRLIRPFGQDFSIKTAFSYYLVSLEDQAQRREVKLFRAWLLEEVAQDNVRQSVQAGNQITGN